MRDKLLTLNKKISKNILEMRELIKEHEQRMQDKDEFSQGRKEFEELTKAISFNSDLLHVLINR